MNYERIHDQIIDRAKARLLESSVYVERHHIVPRSMGGSNSKENLVRLTAREHYIVHWLLYKIHKTSGMAYAWNNMCSGGNNHQYRYSSHTFEYARKQCSIAAAGRITSQETKAILSEKSKAFHKLRKDSGDDIAFYRKLADARMANGYRHSDDTKQKIGAKHRGKVISEHTRKLTGEITKARWQDHIWRNKVLEARAGYTHSDETIEKIRNSNTPEVRAAKSLGGKKQKGIPKQITQCPHCGKSGGSGIMKRWHFDRCNKHEL